ncbi:hypothetical protein BS78_05G027900 [Paspalum vaginatum]|nr:hypothetical protein BS78_05G027900 [Paspalum vaginatum]
MTSSRRPMMASSSSHQQLVGGPILGLLLLLVTLAPAVVDSTRVSTKPAMVIYPSCKTTLMPKRCSIKLSDLAKSLGEAKAAVAGPKLAAEKMKSDSCFTDCAPVLDTAASNVAAATAEAGDEAALRRLQDYLYETVINNYGPIPPCACECPGSCSADESAEVGKLTGAVEAMTAMTNLLKDLLETKRTKENEALAAASEKAIGDGSGVFHASCGTTKQPQKCTDVLAAVLKTAKEAYDEALDLPEPAPDTKTVIWICTQAIRQVISQLESAATSVRNLAEIRASIQSYFQERPCEFSCPPPPPSKEQCSTKEAAVVHKLNGVPDACLTLLDKFLAEEI